MSVSLSLLISTACLDIAMRAHGTRLGRRQGFEMGHEFNELALQGGRIHALVACDEIVGGTLRLKGTQCLGDGFVVDACEEEGSVELASLHVVNEGLAVGCARVADAVFPNCVEVVRNAGGKVRKIVVQVAIAV